MQKKLAVKEKQKAVAFVNWEIPGIKSSRGFALYENEYTTPEEAALIALAQRDGTIQLSATLTVVEAKEKPKSYDISNISGLSK